METCISQRQWPSCTSDGLVTRLVHGAEKGLLHSRRWRIFATDTLLRCGQLIRGALRNHYASRAASQYRQWRTGTTRGQPGYWPGAPDRICAVTKPPHFGEVLPKTSIPWGCIFWGADQPVGFQGLFPRSCHVVVVRHRLTYVPGWRGMHDPGVAGELGALGLYPSVARIERQLTRHGFVQGAGLGRAGRRQHHLNLEQ